jgi:hypothetical protein
MYHNDHAPPHFHASYQGFEALIHIADGSEMAGDLLKKALRIVHDWALQHQAEFARQLAMRRRSVTHGYDPGSRCG